MGSAGVGVVPSLRLEPTYLEVRLIIMPSPEHGVAQSRLCLAN